MGIANFELALPPNGQAGHRFQKTLDVREPLLGDEKKLKY